MDPRHSELARIGLAAVGGFGFALAGGYALAAHGVVDRASEDVDLFTNRLDPDEFARAVDTITHAYHQAGYGPRGRGACQDDIGRARAAGLRTRSRPLACAGRGRSVPTGGAWPAALDQLLVAPVGIVISSVASSMIGLTGQTWLDTL